VWNNVCRWARPRLALLVGDELRGTERRKVERHLIGCDDCQVRLHSLRVAIESLRNVAAYSHEPATSSKPASLWPALARQIRESKHHEPATFAFRPIWMGLGLAASLLGLAGLANWSLNSSQGARFAASKTSSPQNTASLVLKANPVITEANPNSTVAESTSPPHKPDGENGTKETSGSSRLATTGNGRIGIEPTH
jgi:anti-sigma factor RsiW